MGFGADLKDKYDRDNKILEKVTVEDLRSFGMIPEFIGRLPIIFTLSGLTQEMMVKILKEPKNAILKQYQKLLALDEVRLEFDDGALEAIAKKRWRSTLVLGRFEQFLKNICWISCMRFQRMTVLVR